MFTRHSTEGNNLSDFEGDTILKFVKEIDLFTAT
jgi:hypothetical protein